MLKSIKEIYSWKYESCDRCGSCFKIMYEVKDETWINVYGSSGGCYCLNCFIEVAMKKKIAITKDDFEWLALMEEVIDEGLYFNDIINNSKS